MRATPAWVSVIAIVVVALAGFLIDGRKEMQQESKKAPSGAPV
jgi:hypothetical protein